VLREVAKVGGENTNDNQAKEYFRENKEISKEKVPYRLANEG